MARTSLRQIIDEHVERAFIAGASWALIQSGIDSAKAEKQVQAWFRNVRYTNGSLPIIQQSAREQICRALLTAAIDQAAPEEGSSRAETA